MDIVGHKDTVREWEDAAKSTRLHHGWILAGKRGIGKARFAAQAARQVIAMGGGDIRPVLHPDIQLLTNLPKDDKEEKKREAGKPFETKRNISVAQIRELGQRLTTRPTLGTRRAIIIDPADDMERSASNALLKLLEEPPEGTVFFLVAHRPQLLLPTIRSRCRVLRFGPLAPNALRDILAGQSEGNATSAEIEAAIEAASGSVGAAKQFMDAGLAKIAAIMRLLALEGDPGFARRGALATAVGARPTRDTISAILELARSVAAERMHAAKVSEGPTIADTHAQLVRLSREAPTYNYDPGLLVMEIGTLLASLGASTDPAHG